MTEFNYDPQMQPSYKTTDKEEILNESTSNIVKTEIDFATRFINAYINKRDFVLTDCKNAILDYLKMKKEAIQDSIDIAKKILAYHKSDNDLVLIKHKDLKRLIKYIDKQ